MRRLVGTTRMLLLAAACLAAPAAASASGLPKADGALADCDGSWGAPDAGQAQASKDKVLAVPPIGGVHDPRRCDVSSMAIAVRDNGALRDIYYPEDDPQNPDKTRKSPDNRASPPPADQVKVREDAVTSLEQRIRKSGLAIIADCQKSGGDMAACLRAKPVKVLIYTHGGRVSQEGAVFSAEALAPMMMRDGYVPLFLIWNSDDIIAYTDRLCCVREGSVDPDKGFNQWLSIPTRLFADIGSSIATAPENYVQQTLRFKHSIIDKHYDQFALNTWDPEDDCAYFAQLRRPNECPNVIFPEFGDAGSEKDQFELLNGGHKNKRLKDDLLYTVGFVPRVLTTAALSQVGAEEWDNLVRRTRLAFDNESTLVDDPKDRALGEKDCHDDSGLARIDEPLTCPTGGFTEVFNKLTSYFKTLDEADATLAWVPINCPLPCTVTQVPVTIEYYGHSMGAIVGDELIGRYPGFPWSKIVYMAAADTIREAKRTFTLVHDSDPSRTRLQFYNLSLHPINESRERVVYGTFPQGSLLEWIDEMFNRPRTGDDRTFGKWKNDEMSLPTWRRDVLAQMIFRVFPAQNNLNGGKPIGPEHQLFERECMDAPAWFETARPTICHPTTHGGFTDFSFWRQMYLTDTAEPVELPATVPPAEPAPAP